MSTIDVLTLSDVALRVSNADAILQAVGFSASGEVERFISAWARAIAQASASQLPQGAAVRLLPSADPKVDDTAIAALLPLIHQAQTKGEILEVTSAGAAAKRVTIAANVKTQLQAGMWPPNLVAQVSHAEKTCMLYVTAREVRVFGAGTEAIGYEDVVQRIVHSAYDPLRREHWGDGELLTRCAEDRLQDRGRLGIWEEPDRYVLRNSPEELIEEIVTRYLEARLRGYANVTRQTIVPSEGRVDVLVTLADGMQYVVELKWIGRSVKKGVTLDDAACQDLDKKWRCKHVFVIGEESAQAGAIQMSFYFKKLRPRKVYLVAYDCRRVTEQKDASCVSQYPTPPGLTTGQYRIYHVGVDPRVASVKGKAMLPAAKAASVKPAASKKAKTSPAKKGATPKPRKATKTSGASAKTT
ncbi:MAG TPA: hypothetical protein VFQ53_41235 [Kofleriaceae bacterium]|nr:hypothetical protein [Kofleriaceae bacterium]